MRTENNNTYYDMKSMCCTRDATNIINKNLKQEEDAMLEDIKIISISSQKQQTVTPSNNSSSSDIKDQTGEGGNTSDNKEHQ